MKNIQVIDGALNAAYDIFECTEPEFALIFPDAGQNIEFIEDLTARLSSAQLDALFKPIWARPLKKREAMGIHGTLFYALLSKKEFYPNKCEADLDVTGRGWKHG